jgi:hypothetical protein
MNQCHGFRTMLGAAAVALGLTLAACASDPAPTAQLGAARSAIDAAERSGAAERAPAELNNARVKLGRAEEAVEDKQNQRALWLAEEAQVDAEVAGVRAQAAAAQQALKEIDAGTRALGTELRQPSTAR